MLCGLVLAMLGIAPALADGRDGLGLGGKPRLAPSGLLQNDGNRPAMTVSPSEAARIAQQQNGGGKVLSVDRGVDGYSVKLLKNGDVRTVFVPGT